MGSGIAQVAATFGHEVRVYDQLPEALQRAEENLKKTFAKLTERGKFSPEEAEEIRKRIRFVTSLEALQPCYCIIEAIVEDLEVKTEVFKKLEAICSPQTILASNTSSLSIASLAGACQHPQRVLGIHFFNPAAIMLLVEIVPAVQTAEWALKQARDLIESWKKTVVIAKDTPGFIVNRVARPFYGEALRIYEEGMADFATIDAAMKSLGGFRMGPFELMDFIGNDVNYAVTESVFTAFYYDPRYRPSFTQKRHVEAGYWGRKSGRGYYDYGQEQSPQPAQDPVLLQSIFERILVLLINEAADALFLGIASKEDLDKAMMRGVNYPKGLLQWADEWGIENCVHKMDALYEEYREDRYRCSPLLRRMKASGEKFYN
jgi:3-hydroxybutyryl-CoA dehydrogenase